jgi:hypothetical protein
LRGRADGMVRPGQHRARPFGQRIGECTGQPTPERIGQRLSRPVGQRLARRPRRLRSERTGRPWARLQRGGRTEPAGRAWTESIWKPVLRPRSCPRPEPMPRPPGEQPDAVPRTACSGPKRAKTGGHVVQYCRRTEAAEQGAASSQVPVRSAPRPLWGLAKPDASPRMEMRGGLVATGLSLRGSRCSVIARPRSGCGNLSETRGSLRSGPTSVSCQRCGAGAASVRGRSARMVRLGQHRARPSRDSLFRPKMRKNRGLVVWYSGQGDRHSPCREGLVPGSPGSQVFQG